MKNANDHIGKQICVFMACGTEPQPTLPAHTSPSLTASGIYTEIKWNENNVQNIVQIVSLNFSLIKTLSEVGEVLLDEAVYMHSAP
jgi:hypothetical protein